ncbi:hypothetical protein CDV31_015371 [Fusarium ambrosium]|uniref:JmjC domain-containing protein n=1 Tax=Fusarium ambrosium TaxID=131363 RepID=A0A428SQ79_9HYPO|nr:hypothetical protein CDV31_015371 [Fusarium ambrosium]
MKGTSNQGSLLSTVTSAQTPVTPSTPTAPVESAPPIDDTVFSGEDPTSLDRISLQRDQSQLPSQAITSYIDKAKQVIRSAENLFQAPSVEQSRPDSRTRVEFEQALEMLGKVSVGHPMSATEATRYPFPGAPTLPILVIGDAGKQRCAIDDFAKRLGAGKTLDVHDFADDPEIQGRIPKNLLAQEALQLFDSRRDGKGDPINLLNMSRKIDNVVPDCLANLFDYRLIESIEEDNGKSVTKESFGDLNDCASFQLLATKGAIHLPHIDHHGVYTTTFNEEGDKLWLMWPGLGLQGLSQWRQTSQIPDGGVAIYIPQGWTLIQPPSTLHAPLTTQDCLMTGTMHWHSTLLLDILKQTKLEVQDPGLTNEPMAHQFTKKMKAILDLWEKDNPAYTWPPREQLAECPPISGFKMAANAMNTATHARAASA